MEQHNVSLYIMTDGDRTVAEAMLIAGKPAVYGSGSSAREPGDKANARVGKDLALARALHSLASHIERRAHGEVKHAEDIKAHKAEIAERPPKTPGMSRPGIWEDLVDETTLFKVYGPQHKAQPGF